MDRHKEELAAVPDEAVAVGWFTYRAEAGAPLHRDCWCRGVVVQSASAWWHAQGWLVCGCRAVGGAAVARVCYDLVGMTKCTMVVVKSTY